MKTVNRRDPQWQRIYARLNREAKVPTGKELALGLGLAMAPAAPLSSSSLPEPAPQEVGWEHYEDDARRAAAKHNIPVDMFLRLLRTENPKGDPLAVNPKSGATGLGQFMPDTAKIMRIDPSHAESSIDASARYLSELNREFKDWEHAVMAYNWGPGNVRRWLSGESDAPVPAETTAYVAAIEP